MKLRLPCLFIIPILLLAGCALPAKKDKPAINSNLVEPQSNLKFGDVPIPAGFKLLPDESYSFESAGFRVGMLKYRGKIEVERVINFYKEQMPMYNWNLLNVIEYGDRLMNFDRDTESCIITLAGKGKTTTLTISLGPKSQMIKKEAKSLK